MGTNKSKAKQEMSEQGPDPTDMGAPNMQFMIKKTIDKWAVVKWVYGFQVRKKLIN